MLKESFLYRFFKNKKYNSHKIVKYNLNKKFDLEIQINNEIVEIDKKISENGKALLEAQIVNFRSNFSKSNNFIGKIGKNIYKEKLEESINWYQNQLKELYVKRKELQISLEKIKGIFWLSRIKRFLTIILTGFFILLGLFIFLSGFMIIIYLLPLMIIISLGYFVLRKKY